MIYKYLASTFFLLCLYGCFVPVNSGLDFSVKYIKTERLANLENKEIDESSGIDISLENEGIFWTHNDSGDKPRFFAFDKKGKDFGSFEIQGLLAKDWEDISSFTLNDQPFLLLADVGDNKKSRDRCSLIAVREPTVKEGQIESLLQPAFKIDFTYEDGPHNCESIAVDSKNQIIYLVSKEFGKKCSVYKLPLKANSAAIARKVIDLKIPTTTAMDISNDGLRMIVLVRALDGGNAYEFNRLPEEDWGEALKRPSRIVKLPSRQQGESICYGFNDKDIFLTSETIKSHRVCPLYKISD